jgi:adenylate cyclase
MGSTRLVRVDIEDSEQEIVLADVTTIGRQPTNTLQIVDRLVSKEHAVLQRHPETSSWTLRDLTSRNGTYCNEVLVEGQIALRNDDILRIGSTSWRFVAEVPRWIPEEPVVETAWDERSASVHATVQIDLESDFVPSELVFDDHTLRADYDKLRLAYTLSRDLHAAPDIEAVLDRLLNRIFQWMPVDRAVVLFVDDSLAGDPADRLVRAALKTRPGANLGDDQGYLVPRSILKQAVGRREAILSTDAMLDARFNQAESILMQGIRSSMTVPLLTHDRIIGVLHVDSLISSGLFTEKDLAVLAAVSQQASISIDNVLLQRRVLEEAALRSSLSRMLSPNLVERIVSGDLVIEKGGVVKRVTVLFADIRGFTSLTERLPPPDMVAMMNEYFERVSNVVFAHDGTLDKYIGDAVMALWGAPLGTEHDELRAVRAGYEIQQTVHAFNRERLAAGQEQISVGVGIATAQVIAGYVGSTRTMSYTVFGRGVNLAARLCGVANPGEVLLAPTTHAAVRDWVDAEVLPERFLKGMADPVCPVRVRRMVDSPATFAMPDESL